MGKEKVRLRLNPELVSMGAQKEKKNRAGFSRYIRRGWGGQGTSEHTQNG